MGKRKQARPSRPGGSTALTNDNVLDSHVENYGNGELAAVLEDAEEIPGVLNGVEHACSRKRRRLGHENSSDETGIEEVTVEVPLPELGERGIDFAEFTLLHPLVLVNDQGNGKGKDEQIQEAGIRRSPFRVLLKFPAGKKYTGGGYQYLSAEDVTVEVISHSEDDSSRLHLSGKIDGSDSAVSGLVYLIKQDMTYLEARPYEGNSACKFVTFINKNAFDSCALYLGTSIRKSLGKAIQSIFEWLRPELSAESISAYGLVGSLTQIPNMLAIASEKHDRQVEALQNSEEKQHDGFDPTALYEAVMPSRTEPEMGMDFPELIPELRPYQRRAAYWMVQREKGPVVIDKSLDDSGSASTSGVKTTKLVEHPLWAPVDSLDGQSRFFFNPYSGYVSMDPHDFQTYVHGGILADEMGLGKTVEVLACILAHRASKESMSKVMDSANRTRERLMKHKRDRVECSCGATQEDDFYKGSWVQCDHCDAWQHALCVGYSTPVDIDANLRRIAAQAQQVKKDEKIRLGKRVQEVHAMPVNIITKDKSGKRGKNVYGARVQKGDGKSSVAKDDEETFVCGTCADMIGRVEIKGECGATLVVCPAPILRQWQDEVSRHVRAGTLRVLVYEGVQKGATVVAGSLENSKMEKITVVGAHDLATADLVLTSYDTLRADVSHVATSTHKIERSFRQPKRYPVIPTPLTRLQWWRLCLDEAQMVESEKTRATEMAMTLRATHRWCVTGTPIQRGLDDLYGLLRFLGAEPFDTKRWWTIVLKEPYEEGKYGAVCAMHDLFRGLMWRSTKAQVADELGLPPQDERFAWLRFSPIEAHFYRQQHDRCAVRAREVIANYRKFVSTQSSSGRRPGARKELDTNVSAKMLSPVTSGVGSTLSDATTLEHVKNGDLGIKAPPAELEDRLLSNKEAEKLLDQLRCLRQACVHPQVGSAGIRALQRSPMTMDEILEVLVDKAKLEAEDAQRDLFGALNGLAALAIIENDIPLSVQIYREVLSYTEENAQDVRVDPLQKLHTLHNLAEILNVKSRTGGDDDEGHATVSNSGGLQAGENVQRPDVPRTLRDDLLLKQCEEIKSKYLAPFYAKLAAVQADFQSTSKQVQETNSDLSDGGSAWWMEVLTSLEQQPDHGKDFVRKLRDQLLESDHLGEAGKHQNISSIALRFQDISGLKFVLHRELEALEEGRKELLQRLSELGAKMENPNVDDAERAGNCSRCQPDMQGPSCAHCEAEELFQAYENRLFFLKVTGAGDVAVSAEDALIAQHASLALKRRETSSAGLGNKEAVVEVLDRRARNRGVTSAQVSRAPSGTERILTILRGQLTILRGQSQDLGLGRDKLPAARKHLQLLETMRKEFAQARVLAFAQREVLFEVHELSMATTRLRLRFPGEKIPNISVLHPEQVPQQNVRLTMEKFAALDELRRVKGQLRYLNGVKSARQKVEPDALVGKIASSGSNIASKPVESGEEECPICHEPLGSRFMVLPCGHVLCCKCIVNLVERSTLPQGQKKINCPTCRRRANIGEVAYVVNAFEKEELDPFKTELQGGENEKEDADISLSVKGSYGTKLEAVLRRILRLKLEDPEVKVLLFSEWNGVLDVVEHALTTNHISYARVKAGGQAQMNAALDRFRGVEETIGSKKSGKKSAKVDEAPGPVQVLLMPVRLGANGLNLVEAQHVMLLEPLLNPSMEAQAINRVHRIGQTRPTFVHRFIVHDTVEESIYGLRRHKAANIPGAARRTRDVYNLTLKDLSSLFSIQTGDTSHSVQVEDVTPARAAAAAAEARLLNKIFG